MLARPHMGSQPLCILTALYLVAATNVTFWTKAAQYLAGETFALVSLFVAIFALFCMATISVSVKYVTKPVLIALIVIAGLSSWFTDRYGVVLDSDMLRNAFVTTPAEARHLLTTQFFAHVGAFVLLPSALIAWVRIDHRPIGQKVLRNSGMVLAFLLIVTAAGALHSKSYTATAREHRDLFTTLNPTTAIAGAVKFLGQSKAESTVVRRPLGTDAVVRTPAASNGKPRVMIIVAGETARAANFGLNGYERNTTPELEARDVVYFPDTQSCGTATATSLPCMFSNFTRSQYSHSAGLSRETLLDVFAHAGIDVSWWDNNTGSKGIADRVNVVDLASSTDPEFCRDGECQDGIFLSRIDEWLNSVTKDSVLVLHQMGSHGPSYYLRYPEEYRRFVPDCRTSELAKCTDQEIRNAYDNTILYTDHIVATLIDKLKARSDTMSSGLIYVSDHGESLGENGLYLHGAPYLLAPDTQTQVPFLTWFDDEFAAALDVQSDCLAEEALVGAKSHDNLFHTALGMMNVETSVYERSLDVLETCRTRNDDDV